MPGGVAKVRVEGGAEATLDGNRVLVIRESKRWVAIAGVPLSAPQGAKLSLEVRYPDQRFKQLDITVVRKKYPSQHLSVPRDQAELDPEQTKRYEQEREHLRQVLRTFSESPPTSLAMREPVTGRRSGSFGSRRIINGEARSPHSGMDIAAAAGDPVVAASAGRVIDIGEYLFLGKIVVLDHGQGWLSLYAHLSEANAALGDSLAAGARLGKVGMTGRTTGPHLHFSVYLNTAAVDPAIFLGDPK